MLKQVGCYLERGTPKGTVDMARLAGLRPAGVLCEIINDDGEMARLPDLIKFSKEHQLTMISVNQLICLQNDP